MVIKLYDHYCGILWLKFTRNESCFNDLNHKVSFLQKELKKMRATNWTLSREGSILRWFVNDVIGKVNDFNVDKLAIK